MKKLLASMLSVILVLTFATSFSSCSHPEKRKEILEQFREIECSGEYFFVAEKGYTTKTEKCSFRDLILQKMEQDGVNTEYLAGISQTIYYNGFVSFCEKYTPNNGNSLENEKYVLGYIDLSNFSVQAFYQTINSSEVKPYSANESYFIFLDMVQNNYYIIDRKTNIVLKNIDNITPYLVEKEQNIYVENGVEYKIDETNKTQLIKIVDGEEQIAKEFTINYVLERSIEMQEIEQIIKNVSSGAKESEIELMICNNELFIIRESKMTMMGRGVLYPLVFKYTMETDLFEYVGCSEYHDLIAIIKA